MKLIAILFFFFYSAFSNAQITKYYNHNWKECELKYAAFLSVWEQRGELLRRTDYFMSTKLPQMIGYYKDTTSNSKTDSFFYFHANSALNAIGMYKNNKSEGLWLTYYPNGFLKDSTVYKNGLQVGISQSWYQDGMPADSINQINDSFNVFVSRFSNGQMKEAGRFLNNKKQGLWVYFDKAGNKVAKEQYEKGRLISKEYLNKEGLLMDTANYPDRGAAFYSGKKKWVEYLSEHLNHPTDVQLVNTDKIVVVVAFDVDEEGE